MPPLLTSFAPQFLVDDLARSIAYYRDVLGFEFGEPWGGFYAIGTRDGFELHLKEAPKNPAERRHRREHEHLDAYAGVDGIETFYARCLDECENPQATGGHRVGGEGLLRGGSRGVHHRLRWQHIRRFSHDHPGRHVMKRQARPVPDRRRPSQLLMQPKTPHFAWTKEETVV